MLLARSAPSSAAIAVRCASSSSVRTIAARSTSIAAISTQRQHRLLSTQSVAPARKQQSSPLAQTLHFSSSRRSFLHTSSAAWEKVKVPQMAESITEGTLKQWIKKKGDFVNEGDEIATIETDKIDVSVNAPVSGTIGETFAEEEDTVTVGKDLCDIEPGEAPSGGASSGGDGAEEGKKEESSKKEDGDKKEQEQKQQEEQKQKQEKEQKEKREEQTKKAPAQDSKKGEEPTAKAPTESSKTSSKPSQQAKTPSPSESAPKATPGSRDERRVKMSRMRMRIAERLKQSQNTAASLTTFNEIDMSNLMAFRARHKDRILKEHGVKLGFMSAFAKASALALQDIPAANGTIEGEGLGDTIVYHDYVDLSVAVSTEKGLVTPVVRNLESLSMIQIEQEIAALGKKARDNKLTLEDMAGGTFTISNGGVFGSLFGTPILNLPGSAILGMHAINDKPWVVNGKVEIRPIMVVALTYDHRLLDGREAVTFLVKLKQYIEDMPSMLL